MLVLRPRFGSFGWLPCVIVDLCGRGGLSIGVEHITFMVLLRADLQQAVRLFSMITKLVKIW
jgi:hypothetical protein